jgi:hypothetical protein
VPSFLGLPSIINWLCVLDGKDVKAVPSSNRNRRWVLVALLKGEVASCKHPVQKMEKRGTTPVHVYA